MPGSGVNSENIILIAEKTGAKEFHSSASLLKKSEMNFVNKEMNEILEYISVNKDEVSNMKKLLNNFTKSAKK
jgi:copper homeostasis protein